MQYDFKNWDLRKRQGLVRAFVHTIVKSPQDKLAVYRELDEISIKYGSIIIKLLNDIHTIQNQRKLQQILTRIATGTDVITLVGMTGSGKTAFMFYCAEEIYKVTKRKSFFVGFPRVKGIPSYINCIESNNKKEIIKILKKLRDCIIWFDEVSLYWDTKNWASVDNVDLKELMAKKRQRGQTLVFGSQVGADMSLEMYRRGEIILIRKFSFMLLETDNRKEYFRPYKYFFPDNNREMLYISQEYTTKITTYLSSFWTEEISKAFA